MPRRVDHDERRHLIAEAVWRLAVRGGLEDVTLRQVATEAGVSARLAQYYFGTRQQLLLGALEILNAEAEAQAQERLGGLDDLRDIVRGVLLEMLPLDDDRRTLHIVYAAYFVRFLTDPALAEAAANATPELEALLLMLMQQAKELGRIPDDIELPAEVTTLLAAAEGLQTRVLLGQLSADAAVAVIDHQLARIFSG